MKILLLLIFMIGTSKAYSDVGGVSIARPLMREYDLAPSSRSAVVQFPNGSLGVSGSTMNLTFVGSQLHGGSTNYIQDRNTLQSGATFYVSSGTVDGVSFYGGTVTADTGKYRIIHVSTIAGNSPVNFTNEVNARYGVITGSGTLIRNVLSGTFTLDPGSVLAALTRDETVSVPGVVVGDICHCTGAALEAGLAVMSLDVPANDSLKVRLMNASVLSIDPASQSFKFTCIRY